MQQAKECDTIKSAVIVSLQSEETRCVELLRNGNKELLQMYLTAEIATYASLLPASRSLSPEAVVTMGKQFIEHPDVRHLSLSELKTFLSLAFKRQSFGKLYGGFGYDTLLEWFNLFYAQRIDEIIDYREQTHTKYTQSEKTTRTRSEGDAWGAISDIVKNNNIEK